MSDEEGEAGVGLNFNSGEVGDDPMGFFGHLLGLNSEPTLYGTLGHPMIRGTQTKNKVVKCGRVHSM